MGGGGGGVRWTPTAFYFNISRTLENRVKYFCISNDIQCATKIHNRIGCACLIYCLNDPKQFFLDFSEKCPKRSPTSFSPVTSTKAGFGTWNFLTFSFNTFSTLVQSFKFVPSPSPKLLNLNKDHPSKKVFFLVKYL